MTGMNDIFFELFEPLDRQGPGNLASAQRALGLCHALPRSPDIVDLGCGAGGQTLQLAGMTSGFILAVDSHAPLIERLNAKLDASLRARVEARVKDMSALDLPPESFDLVWSEGALYNLGLEAALPICANLLRPDGTLVFTDAVWHSHDPPKDILELFAEYPTMGTVGDVLALLERSGWRNVSHFDLPSEAWWDDFYTPMEKRIEEMRTKYAHDTEALAALDELAKEPQMHRDSGHHYGYTFFIAQRPQPPSP